MTPQDSQIIAGVQAPLESILNLAAGTVVFNIIVEFFVNTWQLLPAGAVFGTLIFLADMGTTSSHRYSPRGCVAVRHCDGAPAKRNAHIARHVGDGDARRRRAAHDCTDRALRRRRRHAAQVQHHPLVLVTAVARACRRRSAGAGWRSCGSCNGSAASTWPGAPCSTTSSATTRTAASCSCSRSVIWCGRRRHSQCGLTPNAVHVRHFDDRLHAAARHWRLHLFGQLDAVRPSVDAAARC